MPRFPVAFLSETADFYDMTAPFSLIDTRALAVHYSRFRVSERILLTGHSHQAWPDVALRGLEESFTDAAEGVDRKWERAFKKAERVRSGFRKLLGGMSGDIALASNTHELLVRLLSALPLKEKPEIVVTDGEFHTVRRQLGRLSEEGVRIRWVPANPPESVGERLAEAVGPETALVICSSVFFETGRIAHGLAKAAEAARDKGAVFLVDTYHHLNALPFDPEGLESAFVLGGGYKYCQLGEGNCFLRSPEHCDLRPVITGWFADFGSLENAQGPQVAYGAYPGARFAGATYDPVSHYRAAEVFDFFERESLTVERLRATSQRQLGILANAVDRIGVPESLLTRDRTVPLSEFGGFLSLRTPHAGVLQSQLAEQGVLTDHRGQYLRLGPAPYLTDEQLEQSVEVLKTQVLAL